ncbi:MAG: hypothetical protein O3B24_03040 [Verrucomicrobia bacterium]|nr:hypothetical protein [Verrucomicrobiota bacterium]
MNSASIRFMAITVLTLPAAALAHPGHAALDCGLAHATASPSHLPVVFLLAAGLAMVITAGQCAWTRRFRSGTN